MDRREVFGILGALGAGLVGSHALRADDHGAHPHGSLQGPTPVSNLHAHFCGIHMAKSNPKFQIVTQHYCGQVSDEVHQCLLFDSCDKQAKLLGVEYIISDRLYRDLADEEKKYWHPHTYEVLGGGLIAPEMAADDEMKFMKALLTTWGKTWHTWPDPTTKVPLGEPLLIWSLMADSQADPKVVAARDKQFGVSTAKIRADRAKAFGMDVPSVSLPKSMDTIGRQWTDEGEDKPTKRD
ncbi:MAG: OBAP family protein [Planctomycetes bacterium]|nr:OBAP family protein [Planctomycetota bacterium]